MIARRVYAPDRAVDRDAERVELRADRREARRRDNEYELARATARAKSYAKSRFINKNKVMGRPRRILRNRLSSGELIVRKSSPVRNWVWVPKSLRNILN